MITQRTWYKALMATPARWKTITHLARFLKIAPRLWHLEPETQDHEDQAWDLVDDASQWNRVSEFHDVHQNMVVAIQETMEPKT